MYARSDSQVVFGAAARNTQPEIFTFERVPAAPPPPPRPRRKPTRVLYPSTVRRHLPPAEKSPAKRWLLVLCLVVLFQIWTEEAAADGQCAAELLEAPGGDASFARYRVLPFRSAEEQARRLTGDWMELLNETCPTCEEQVKELYEKSTRNSYVVALLYPVYHTLGGDN
ncbi:radiation-inducible immediate-early gene IEX-1 [Denticeps clupeoides]|uniref:Uncharacterized protein n=1 Tax=Denticeps clupeoides TaxID=299321 RepID=A0AAY4BTE5_9TELE|nr:radiation-inducible immediate-early gene IEX-1-like [Denticeps clupeoides]